MRRNRCHPGPRSRRGGSGLIVMALITLAVVLLLYFANLTGGGSSIEHVAQTRRRGLEASLQLNTQQLVTLIVQHKLANDRLPQSMEELDAPPSALADPWGRPMTFEYEEEGPGPALVIVRSAGPDGEPGTGDDIIVRERLPL